jgi:hypothetical protein
LDGENPLYTVKQRLFDLGIRETHDLSVWGGWNVSPPQGPQSRPVIDFARQCRPLIIFDSLIEFHPGSEQSSTETRAFMKHFRALANLGATVIILHHTGKAESSRVYRGSSDIKAAVDTAYLLAKAPDAPEHTLGLLSLTCFKGRLAPGQNFGMEFRQGQGFVARNAFERTRTTTEVVKEIISTHPSINQKKVIEIGRTQGCGKRQLEDCLKTGRWQRDRGANNSILYSLPADAPDQEDEN